MKNTPCSFLLKLNNNKYIFGGIKGMFFVEDIFDEKKIPQKINNLEDYYRSGIVISDNFFALISNKILNGKNTIKFFEINPNNNTIKLFNEINGYSIIHSQNTLLLMDIGNIEENKKILLCACKKYYKNEKNGFLLIFPKLKNYKFYSTDDFEIYCFCRIKINENNYIIKKEEEKIKDFQIVLVGGYDKTINLGLIKFYSIKIGNNFEPKIELVNDININSKNDGHIKFKGPITSIIQNGKFLFITCYNIAYKYIFDINLNNFY